MSKGKNYLLFYSFIFFIFLAKNLFVLFFGPLETPDTIGYIAFANMILSSDTKWIHDAGLYQSSINLSTFRTIGYPIIIALTEFFSGKNFKVLLVILQSSLTTISCAYMYIFIYSLCSKKWPAIISVFFIGIFHTTLWDISLLTDSFFASFYMLLFSILSYNLLKKNIPSKKQSLLLSFCFIGLILLRSNGLFVILTLLPLIAFLIYFSKNISRIKIVFLIILFVPSLFTMLTYYTWNFYRSGNVFVSTGGQTVLLQPLFRMVKNGVDVFDEDNILDNTVKEHARNYDFSEIITVNQVLFEKYGWSGLKISEENYKKYFSTIKKYPIQFIMLILNQFNTKVITSLINPIFLSDYFYWHATNERHLFPSSSIFFKNFNQWDTLYVFLFGSLLVIFSALSIILFLIFTFIIPCVIIRQWKKSSHLFALLLSLEICYWGVVLMYAMTHLELRYLVGVMPIPIILSFFWLSDIKHRTVLEISNNLIDK